MNKIELKLVIVVVEINWGREINLVSKRKK